MKILRVLMMVTIISFSIYAKEPLKSYKEGQKLYVWVREGLKMMKQPSIDGYEMTTLPYGTEIEVLYQDEKVPINLELHLKKYEDRKATDSKINFDGFWLKVRNGTEIGYVFNKFVLEYRPFELEFKNKKDYLIGYFRENFCMKLVDTTYNYYEIKKDNYKDTYNFKYASQSNNIFYEKGELSYKKLIKKMDKSYNDGGNKSIIRVQEENKLLNIKISNINFDEAIVFFTLIFEEEEYYNLPYTYDKNKSLIYNILGDNSFNRINFNREFIEFELSYNSRD